MRIGWAVGDPRRPANGSYARGMAEEPVPGSEQLVGALAEAETLLREQRDCHWADWLARDRLRLAQGDAYGLHHITQAFGGMGSINDTYPAGEERIGARPARIYGMAAQLLANRRAGGLRY